MEYWSPSRRPESGGVMRPARDDTATSEPAAGGEWRWSIEFAGREVGWLLFLRWLYRQGRLNEWE